MHSRAVARRTSVLPALLLACIASAAADSLQRIELPAGDLLAAVETLARHSDVELVYQPEKLKGVKTAGVSGRFTMREAITKLLEGTQLRLSLDASTGAMLIVAEDEETSDKQARADQSLRMALTRVEVPEAGATQAGSETLRRARAENDAGSKAEVQQVIVTATRRRERLQDVPISMAVVTSQDISRRGLHHSEDYLRGIAGVNQSEMVPSGQAIVIRGLETQLAAQNYFAGPMTATYFGETPTTSSGGLNASSVDIKLVDIDRVEVLRGPQGTAFGSSSMGGAVRTIPVTPKLDRFEGAVGADYSQTSGTGGENYRFHAIGNIPLVHNRLAIRSVAYRFQESGFYRNRAGSDAQFQTSYVIPNGLQAFATDQEKAGAYSVIGGRISALFQATEKLKLTLTYLTQDTETDGFPVETSGKYEQTLLQVAPEHVRRRQAAGFNDFSIDVTNAVLEYDFGWADLLATYSRVEGYAVSSAPYGAQGLTSIPWAASAFRAFPHRNDVGEIRLATRLDGTWNFLAGLYAEKQSNTQDLDVVWHGDQSVNPFGQREDVLVYLNQRDLRQQAAFAEVSWKLLPRFTLTAGIRGYEYERINKTNQGGPLLGGLFTRTREETDASGRNLRANLSYKPTEDSLLYAGWAQGFRLGQPLPPVPAGLCDVDSDGIIDETDIAIESTKHLDSDTVDSYELGGKFALLDRRMMLEAAVFRMDWSEIPVHRFLPCQWNHYFNAGSARSEGIELQAGIRINQAWRADVSASYIHARLTQDAPAQGFSSGDRLPGAPRVNGSLGLEYEFTAFGHPAFARADAIYVGAFYADVIERSSARAGDYVKLNATARIVIDRLSVDVYVRNVTDEDAFTNRGQFSTSDLNGYRMRPRTIGLQLGYDF